MLIPQTNFRAIFHSSSLSFFVVALAMPVKLALNKKNYHQKFQFVELTFFTLGKKYSVTSLVKPYFSIDY